MFPQSGDCSAAYSYSGNIENGVITSPDAETGRGNIQVRARFVRPLPFRKNTHLGSGKLTGVPGRGTPIGYSGDHYAGSWTAQRVASSLRSLEDRRRLLQRFGFLSSGRYGREAAAYRRFHEFLDQRRFYHVGLSACAMRSTASFWKASAVGSRHRVTLDNLSIKRCA